MTAWTTACRSSWRSSAAGTWGRRCSAACSTRVRSTPRRSPSSRWSTPVAISWRRSSPAFASWQRCRGAAAPSSPSSRRTRPPRSGRRRERRGSTRAVDRGGRSARHHRSSDRSRCGRRPGDAEHAGARAARCLCDLRGRRRGSRGCGVGPLDPRSGRHGRRGRRGVAGRVHRRRRLGSRLRLPRRRGADRGSGRRGPRARHGRTCGAPTPARFCHPARPRGRPDATARDGHLAERHHRGGSGRARRSRPARRRRARRFGQRRNAVASSADATVQRTVRPPRHTAPTNRIDRSPTNSDRARQEFHRCFSHVPLFTWPRVSYGDRRGDASTGNGGQRRRGWCHRGVGTGPCRVRGRVAPASL